MQSVTQQAMNLVGNDQPTDWELAPEKHAAALGAGAEPLKEILLKPDIGKIITDFRVADRAAGRAQKTYKRLADPLKLVMLLMDRCDTIARTCPAHYLELHRGGDRMREESSRSGSEGK